MEEQCHGDPIREDATFDPTSSTTLSSSEVTLRFPRPQGNRHLASWISSSDPDIMNPSTEDAPDDACELAESSYEFINTDINTDDDSQDDRTNEGEAESLSSFDYARPDDVHSLDGVERIESRSDTDSDEENAAEDRSRASSIQYAEQSLLNPSSRVATPPLRPEDGAGDASIVTLSALPIEFDETEDPVYFKQVSVKHATHSFTEGQSASIAQSLNFSEQATRLIAAVRQTMASHCLTTKGPLRIMYTGSVEAKDEIVDKISSACTACTSPDGQSEHQKSDTIHAMTMPFNSAKALKVEHCTAAKTIIYQGEQFPGETVYSITIDNDGTYQSVFAPSGSVIEPSWTLPHIAVFYVTEDDDEAAQKTRGAAWGFMQRHAVPCIMISKTELFQRPTDDWSHMINQHAVHRCVESSDRAFPSVRLPIDLESFKKIDARQMNRNLAYLTGLYEAAGAQEEQDSKALSPPMKAVRNIRQYAVTASEDVHLWSLAQSIGLSGMVVVALLLCNWYLAGSSSAPASPVPTAPYSSPAMSITPTYVATSTITINLTSTTTIRVPPAKASQGSMAVAPFAEIADFLADRFPDSQKENVCSAEKYSRNEILVKIPSSTKTSWLAKDSITIGVFSDDRLVKTKFSSIDEGILIEIPKKDAHGMLTIVVQTTRKPKVDESFSIDFGKTNLEHLFGYGKYAANRLVDAANSAAEQAMNLGHMKTSVMQDMKEVSTRISREAANTASYIKMSWRPGALVKTWEDMRHSRHAQDVLDWMDVKHKNAQIRSWLLWLQIQRRTEEYDTYLVKAKKYLAEKTLAAERASKERLDRERRELRARRKRERLEARCQSGFARWTQQCKQQD